MSGRPGAQCQRAGIAGLVLAAVLASSASMADPWNDPTRDPIVDDPVSGAVGGAVVGGALGAIIAGGSGAAVGAVVIGTMGAKAGADGQQIRRENERQYEYGQRSEWERERRRKQQQMEQQREVVWLSDADDGQPLGTMSPNDGEDGANQRGAGSAGGAGDSTLIIETQRSLIRLGFDPGDVGSLNRQTEATISIYQRQHGLVDTGQPSQALLKHMIRNGG